MFRCEVGKADGSDPGDGVLFRVIVVDETGTETVVAERQWMEHAWTPLEADLTRWSGQQIRLKLVCDVGPADNSSGDWGCWANLRVESRDPVLGDHDSQRTGHADRRARAGSGGPLNVSSARHAGRSLGDEVVMVVVEVMSYRVMMALLLILSGRASVAAAEVEVVTARRGMVVSVSAPASEAGAAILRRGGNACRQCDRHRSGTGRDLPAGGQSGRRRFHDGPAAAGCGAGVH